MNMTGLLIRQSMLTSPPNIALAKTQGESGQDSSFFQQNLINELSVTQNLINKHSEANENSDDQNMSIWAKLQPENQVGQPSSPIQDSELVQLDHDARIEQFKELFSQAESLLAHLNNEDELVKVSPEILEVLEKWTALERQIDGQSILHHDFQLISESETQVLNLWRDLVNNFQVQNELVSNHYYISNEKLTSLDIVEWLKNSLNTQESVEKRDHSQPTNIQLNDIGVEDLLTQINTMPVDMLNELYYLLTGNAVSVDEVSEDEVAKNLITLVHNLSNDQGMISSGKLATEIPVGQDFKYSQLASYFMPPTMIEKTELTQLDNDEIMKEYKALFTQVESLLTNQPNDDEMLKISSRILELLEKWVALDKRYDSEEKRLTLSQTSTDSGKVLRLWNDLVSSFQKRNELASSQYYQASAKVTSKDISEWLKMNVNAQHSVENQIYTQQVNLAQQPLSKVEQYVIYMNQNDAVTSTDKQLIDQFQQVMKTSRFLSLNNGVNQLSIALRPDNLGEMMVRFTEINGEMTLKIIVSSQATRQMLEANIHQLKNMFSPHQVIIEEREAIIENVQSQSDEQAFEEEEDHSNESSQEESRNLDEEFETEFHEILMNEKV